MTSTRRSGQIITFYSYKGGTGRTMSLANVAYLLSQSHGGTKSVLAIDWDLEAPGLHLFFQDLMSTYNNDLAKADASLNDYPGLIDLFVLIRDRIGENTTQSEEESAKLLKQVVFDHFVLRTDIHNLHLLKAGKFDAEYSRRVNTFQWEALYNRSPWLFQALAELLVQQYDYVLIDSRTGRTDTSNICTMLIPQKLVVVFTPNRQSLTGIEELVKEATAYRRKSDDFRTLLVYPLPSRIEASEPERREQWRSGDQEQNIVGYEPMFEKIFKEAYDLPKCDLEKYFDNVQIQHVPAYAYGESLAVVVERSSDISSLHFRFKVFCDWIIGDLPPWESAGVGVSLSPIEAINLKIDDFPAPWQGPPLKLYLSYARQDEGYVDELRKDLRVMERNGLISVWSTHEISSGEKWEHRSINELHQADIIVCQISRDFLASDFLLMELNVAYKRMLAGTAQLVAYILTACGWKDVPELQKGIQVLPPDAKPLSEWKNRDKYWRAVAEGIRSAVQNYRKLKSLPLPPNPRSSS